MSITGFLTEFMFWPIGRIRRSASADEAKVDQQRFLQFIKVVIAHHEEFKSLMAGQPLEIIDAPAL